MKISCFTCFWCPALELDPQGFSRHPDTNLELCSLCSCFSKLSVLATYFWTCISNLCEASPGLPCHICSPFQFFSLLFLLIVVAPLKSSHLVWHHHVTPLPSPFCSGASRFPLSYFSSPLGLAIFSHPIIFQGKGLFFLP